MDDMTLTTVLIDISAVSVLLFLAFLIRQKIPFFYKYYIPTSLIAGILGLLLGPQVLGQFSPVHLQFSEWDLPVDQLSVCIYFCHFISGYVHRKVRERCAFYHLCDRCGVHGPGVSWTGDRFFTVHIYG